MLSRLKFAIQPLVNEMLDQLPARVWASSTTTFLDPSMGGGQFLVEIEKRLRAAGHSDSNISTRIYGCEKNKLRVNYAKNNKKLVAANLFVSDFLNHEWGNMKFDVVIGNPPYVDSSVGRVPLYTKFVELSENLSKGVVALVIPSGFATSDEKGGDAVRKIISSPETSKVKFLGAHAFENAQVSTLYFIRDKQASGATTIENDGQSYTHQFSGEAEYIFRDPTLWSILQKCKTHNSTKSWIKVNQIDKVSKSSSVKTVVKVTKNDIQYEMGDETDPWFGKHRVVTSFLPNAAQHLEVAYYVPPNIAVKKGYMVCVMNSETEAKNLAEYLKSNLCRVIHSLTQTSRTLRTPQLKFIPELDLTQTWDNSMLYQHFGLSPAEIAYIEGSIK